MTVSENYNEVLHAVELAAERSGRKADDVKLIAVSKGVDARAINEALAAGARYIGESRAQEWQKKRELIEGDFKLHWIGALQTNKVNGIADYVDTVHSVDRPELARRLSEAALRGAHESIKVLVQVNIGSEERKSGVHPEALTALLDEIVSLDGLRIIGLMCIPPVCSADESRKYFARLRELSETAKSQKYPRASFDELSMGMSSDYEQAILEGATMVRIGSAIFGSRL